jgi:hypothetical protein
MLNEFCLNTGYPRKYAIRLRNGAPPGKQRERGRRERRPRYGRQVLAVLASIWEAAGYPWSVRRKALLPNWMPWIRPGYRLRREMEKPLLGIRARQIDRRLQAKKSERKRRIYGRTRPGSLWKHPIPIKTDRWEGTSPGFSEKDLGAHSGDLGEGDFAHSLNLTEIPTGWTESRALLGKSQVGVQEALDEIAGVLPFRLLGLDSDHGSEFINWHLKRWCEQNQIQLTRGRPYKKDDNAHVEQKNGTHERKLLGWERYDSRAAGEAINDLYRHELRLWLNLYLPSVKRVKKVRVGSKLRRVSDAAQTPWERVLACAQGTPAQVAELKKLRHSRDPFQLGKTMERKRETISEMANRRLSPKPRPDQPVSTAEQKRQTTLSRRNGCGKAAPWKSPKPDFSTELGNRANSARFPLSHNHDDGGSPVTFPMSRRPAPGLHS